MDEWDSTMQHRGEEPYLRSLAIELTREEKALLQALLAHACSGSASLPLKALALHLHRQALEASHVAHALQHRGLVGLLPDGENEAMMRVRLTLLGKRTLTYLP